MSNAVVAKKNVKKNPLEILCSAIGVAMNSFSDGYCVVPFDCNFKRMEKDLTASMELMVNPPPSWTSRGCSVDKTKDHKLICLLKALESCFQQHTLTSRIEVFFENNSAFLMDEGLLLNMHTLVCVKHYYACCQILVT